MIGKRGIMCCGNFTVMRRKLFGPIGGLWRKERIRGGGGSWLAGG